MLLLKPQVLLLDEATSALDETTAEAMAEMLRLELKNSAILLVTHQSVLVRHADQVLEMKDFLCQHTEKTSLSRFPDMKTQFLFGDSAIEALAELKIFGKALIGGELPNIAVFFIQMNGYLLK